eukprot:symbB.v1.2.021098.t1/scaffold1717.1/size104954/1
MISHGGQIRKTHVLTKREAAWKPESFKGYFSIPEEEKAWAKLHPKKESKDKDDKKEKNLKRTTMTKRTRMSVCKAATVNKPTEYDAVLALN